MTTLYKDLLDRFSELHSEIGKSLEGLPAEALDWVPGPNMNSIAVLVTHLTGAEGYLVGVAINKPPERDRDAEFQVKGLNLDELKRRVISTDEFVRQALDNLSINDLESLRHSPRHNKSLTVSWCLAHALEHTALHTGHLQMTRQLWDLRKPA